MTEKLKNIAQNIINSDNKGTQNPIYAVYGTPKNYGLDYDEEDDGEEKEQPILSYHFCQQDAQEYIDKYQYKYDDMNIFVKSWYDNDQFTSIINAIFEATGEQKPKRYN